MSTTLRLGIVDRESEKEIRSSILKRFHADLEKKLREKLRFRGEAVNEWYPIKEIDGTAVQDLQVFLKKAGFMPHGPVDRIYGYRTRAGVRLFQEYVRTVENNPTIGTPDGLAGPNTLRHIKSWKDNTPDKVCQWALTSSSNGSDEFKKWIGLLEKAKNHYLNTPHPILQFLESYTQNTDTLKISKWDVSPETIHLIGIRRNQDMMVRNRPNDDLFVLLINGMVFKFWGSTDPSQAIASSAHIEKEAFLTEGQHLFKFGWHKFSSANHVYQAMEPAQHGVLVFRDRNKVNALTDANIAQGLDDNANLSINIHWSGIGSYNFSAGCQVIAGNGYINSDGEAINCSKFAAKNKDALTTRPRRTRGAYNVLADLILNYAPPGVHTVTYTLARDETSFLSEDIDEAKIEGWVEAMRKMR